MTVTDAVGIPADRDVAARGRLARVPELNAVGMLTISTVDVHIGKAIASNFDIGGTSVVNSIPVKVGKAVSGNGNIAIGFLENSILHILKCGAGNRAVL